MIVRSFVRRANEMFDLLTVFLLFDFRRRLLIEVRPIFARFDHDDQVSIIRIEIMIVFEKVELRIVRLFRFQHDFHLNARNGDEIRRFLDHRVQFDRLGLKEKRVASNEGEKSRQRTISIP